MVHESWEHGRRILTCDLMKLQADVLQVAVLFGLSAFRASNSECHRHHVVGHYPEAADGSEAGKQLAGKMVIPDNDSG